ncbi:hypothetical protein EDC28_102297 [Gallaecimonas pentaromativorans]|uniref:Uncharacterized protein n=1 Tax=Gallaecimonas pentaromativorans TaxID=584787 RepID=A0A3N1PEN6_9GAMM|nr:hypothetical protein EDC28_102297 [Gallaecimonas pentaromativorans]
MIGWWIALIVLLVIVGNLALLWPRKPPGNDKKDPP